MAFGGGWLMLAHELIAGPSWPNRRVDPGLMVAGLAGALAVFGAALLTSLSSRGKAAQSGSALLSGEPGGGASA